MSDSSDSRLREYGLEFIKDLAKDRKHAMQSLGVSFTGFKNDLMRRSGLLTRVEDRNFVEELLKEFDEAVNRTIESQLTRITIKSFNWIKKVMMQDERIIIQKTDEELVARLQEDIKTYKNEISRLTHEKDSLDERLKTTEKKLKEIELEYNDYKSEMKQKINTEISKNENLERQLGELKNQIKELTIQIESKNEQIKTLEEKRSSLDMELIEKTAEIARLNAQMDAQAAEAMETWATTYTEQQQQYQKALQEQQELYKKAQEQFQITLTRVKQEYEENMKKKLRENTKKFQDEIDQITAKLREEQKRREAEEAKARAEITELSTNLEFVKEKNISLDSQITALLEENERLMKERTEFKIKYDELKTEIEHLEKKEQAKASGVSQQSFARIKNVNEYIESVLSLSNYAPITILVRMNGKMTLESLAKSVGMDPIVLENQLQPLHQRDLIDIRRDGLIIANIPNK